MDGDKKVTLIVLGIIVFGTKLLSGVYTIYMAIQIFVAKRKNKNIIKKENIENNENNEDDAKTCVSLELNFNNQSKF